VLVVGEPGAGKSTLLAQFAARAGARALYASGEESSAQVADRMRRLGLELDVQLVGCRTLAELAAAVEVARPALVVVDSVQVFRCEGMEGAPGSVGQVREVTGRLVAWAKASGVTLLLVGHVTKDGLVAGPKTLEHLVDTVLVFDGREGLRLVRCVKNRFGPTGELAVLEMTAEGLVEVDDLSARLLGDRPSGAPGSVVTATVEGAHAVCVEVQALVTPTAGTPQRSGVGVDTARVKLLAAVLERRGGLALGASDVLVSVVGGVELASDRGADLAVCAAIVSSAHDVAVPEGTAFLGEVGLAGEVRGVGRVELRAAELARVGFGRVVGGKGLARAKVEGAVVVGDVGELVTLFEARPRSGHSRRELGTRT
jgi:DNA repair protein RadA/Sms